MAQTEIKVAIGIRRWPVMAAIILGYFVWWWPEPIKQKIAQWLAERAVWVRDAD